MEHEVLEVDEAYAYNLYMKPHWVRAITKTQMLIGNVKESVVALINHG